MHVWSFEIGLLEHSGAYGTQGAWRDLAHGSSSTGYAKEEGRSHLEDQLDRPLDQPVEFLNSTGQASTRSSWGVKIPLIAKPCLESDEKLRKDVKALNEKLDKLILAQSTMKKVNFVSAEEMEPVQEGEDTQFAEVCYMSNGQGGYNKGYYNYKSNPAMSYRNTDVANPQDQVYPQQQAARSSQVPQHGYGQKNNYQGPQGTFPGQQMNIPPGFPHQPPQPAPSQENELKAMLKQLLQGQADGVVDTSKKLAEINSKIENLNTRVYSLENHASSVAAATKQGQLPGKAIQNPKEQCKVIFTQEGLVEEEDQERVIEDFCLLLNDEEIVAAEAPGVQIDQPEVHAPTVAIHTSPVELARQARSAARSSPTLARSSPTSSVRQPVLLDPYQPVAASSSRLLSQGHKEVIHKFRRDLSGIGIELPLWIA
ncbi:unnamed protein product [Microthlaspi erraticum]|uniref:Uncharacterized protein n=1 Tax=Microthlaspi erraticum TaxID=1685480 RepID=A0A6D2K1K9_9BRAS|nr:unnamed protein product [Microthlaspi erraticum]